LADVILNFHLSQYIACEEQL